MLIAVLVRQKI